MEKEDLAALIEGEPEVVAEGTARMLNALSEAHAVHAEHAAAGFEAGQSQAQSDQAGAPLQAAQGGVSGATEGQL